MGSVDSVAWWFGRMWRQVVVDLNRLAGEVVGTRGPFKGSSRFGAGRGRGRYFPKFSARWRRDLDHEPDRRNTWPASDWQRCLTRFTTGSVPPANGQQSMCRNHAWLTRSDLRSAKADGRVRNKAANEEQCRFARSRVIASVRPLRRLGCFRQRLSPAPNAAKRPPVAVGRPPPR